MNTTRITIPVDDAFRTQLVAKAHDLGFDSAQAMFRFIGKAVVDGRAVDFDEPRDWGTVPPLVVARLEADIDEMATQRQQGHAASFETAHDLVADLES
ncbi:hypothetical protein KA093_02480 [Candidatus Saccharibacteria bacterium]|nr:hypothetical protein [Candidatus Saccharibacteria bacterium]